MRQSELDLLRKIHDSPKGLLELPNGFNPEYQETLRYLVDNGYVRLHPPHRTHPDTCLYSLDRDGLEAIEESDKLREKEAEDKKNRAKDRRIAILSPILLLLTLIVSLIAVPPERWRAVLAFIQSLLKR